MTQLVKRKLLSNSKYKVYPLVRNTFNVLMDNPIFTIMILSNLPPRCVLLRQNKVIANVLAYLVSS